MLHELGHTTHIGVIKDSEDFDSAWNRDILIEDYSPDNSIMAGADVDLIGKTLYVEKITDKIDYTAQYHSFNYQDTSSYSTDLNILWGVGDHAYWWYPWEIP